MPRRTQPMIGFIDHPAGLITRLRQGLSSQWGPAPFRWALAATVLPWLLEPQTEWADTARQARVTQDTGPFGCALRPFYFPFKGHAKKSNVSWCLGTRDTGPAQGLPPARSLCNDKVGAGPGLSPASGWGVVPAAPQEPGTDNRLQMREAQAQILALSFSSLHDICNYLCLSKL